MTERFDARLAPGAESPRLCGLWPCTLRVREINDTIPIRPEGRLAREATSHRRGLLAPVQSAADEISSYTCEILADTAPDVNLRCFSKCEMGKDGMNAFDAVNDLGYPEVNDKTGETKRLSSCQTRLLFDHQVQHCVEGNIGCFIQIFVKAECETSSSRVGARRGQASFWIQAKGEFHALHRTFQSQHGHFTIPLRPVAVANREESTRHGDGQKKGASNNQFPAVDIPAGKTRWCRGKNTGFIGRHSHHTHKRTQRDDMSVLILRCSRCPINFPAKGSFLGSKP